MLRPDGASCLTRADGASDYFINDAITIGWTYNVTTIDGDGRAITDTVELASIELAEGWHMNMVMMLAECSYMDGERAPNGLKRRTFVVVAPVNLAGKKFTAQDVKPLGAVEDGTLTCVFDTGKAKVHALLNPNFRDNVTEWLPLDRESRFHFPRRYHKKVEEERIVRRSFFHWLRHEGDDSGVCTDKPPMAVFIDCKQCGRTVLNSQLY